MAEKQYFMTLGEDLTRDFIWTDYLASRGDATIHAVDVSVEPATGLDIVGTPAVNGDGDVVPVRLKPTATGRYRVRCSITMNGETGEVENEDIIIIVND